MTGTAVFRYSHTYGWQVFDWVPSHAGCMQIKLLVIRDRHDKASLLRLDGNFIMTPRRGQFCKQPHKLVLWPAQAQQRLAA